MGHPNYRQCAKSQIEGALSEYQPMYTRHVEYTAAFSTREDSKKLFFDSGEDSPPEPNPSLPNRPTSSTFFRGIFRGIFNPKKKLAFSHEPKAKK